jgi:hypothetical protein
MYRLRNARGSAAGAPKIAVEIAIAEVVMFALYQVIIVSINNANATANGNPLKGTNGVLTSLVTVFYVLGAALIPVAIIRHAGFM